MKFLQSQKTIAELCNDNKSCINKNCESKHPRALSGVCIGNLKKICNDEKLCGLQHFTIQELKKKLQSPINGIYQINLCKLQDCKDADCQYLHPEWKTLVCWDCLNCNGCDKHIEEEHVWDWLKGQVYQQYDKQECNPENLCSCSVLGTCLKRSHQLSLDRYCIQYFQGICPSIICIKQHAFWEQFKMGAVASDIEDQVLKPCITINQSNKSIFPQKQTYQQHYIFQKKEELQQYQMLVFEQKIIDIIIILDVTARMQPWIDVAKNNISAIIREFKKAVVCFRDFCDKPKHIFSHNFTTRSELIEQFLNKMQAKGGDDLPEDLIGALEAAYHLNISTYENSMLHLYIITDAPCHGGKHYHSLMFDEYKDQEGKLEVILEKFKELKNRFFVTFFQLSPNTLIMEKIMKDLLMTSFFTAKVDQTQFRSYVKFSLKNTFQQSKPFIFDTKECEIVKAKYDKQRKMPFNYDRRNPQSSYTNYFSQQLETKMIRSETVLQIDQEEFHLTDSEKGALSTIFRAFDQKNNRYVVLKIPQSILTNYKKGVLNVFQVEQAEKEARTKYRLQLMAQQLASEFNRQIIQNNLQSDVFPIYYASPVLYMLEKPFKGLTLIYGETFIDVKNKQWTKYSGNYDKVFVRSNLIVFSHFSYEMTNHELMITDLQGKINLLTDPAIISFLTKKNFSAL